MLRRLSPFILVGVTALGPVAGGGGCDEQPLTPTGSTTSAASGIAGAPTDGDGGGGGAGGAPDGGGGGGAAAGGSAPAILIGLIANPAREGEATPSRVAEVEAAASAYAAGARIAAIKRRWADADAATLAEDAALAQAGCGAAPCRPVALTLAVVDGALDGRPADVAGGPWSAAAAEQAFDASLDAAFDVFGDDLAVLTIGARVDRWITLHQDDEEALGAFLARAVDRALERGREGLLVGVGVSGESALADAGPAVELRALGTATMISLFPGMHQVTDGSPLPSPAAAALVLDAIDGIDPGRPVALVEVGYPSSEALGGSEDAQAVFYASLFAALDSRRGSFPVVVASRLHDLGEDACSAEGQELGEDDALVLAYRCSTGLRSSSDLPKPSWTSLLGGVAKLASGGTAPRP